MVSKPWKIYGPFDLDKNDPRSWKPIFREAVVRHNGLSGAIGVYVIGIANGKKDRIKYIGMTHNQGFESEVFSQRNCGLVFDPLTKMRCRAIRVWLFAKPKEKGGFSVDQRMFRQSHVLEQLLIMHARASGHELINSKKMKSAEGIAVAGLFGVRQKGAPSKAAVSISKALLLRP